uniref:Complex 1 LYR protein domain-containing protein n=1 Tax=Hucho hucho TaxID=62062 RepID=A0A4W5PZ86_9TELE
MASSVRSQVLSLYHLLMKEKLYVYIDNLCVFIQDVYLVQDAFRANQSVEDPKTVEQLLN